MDYLTQKVINWFGQEFPNPGLDRITQLKNMIHFDQSNHTVISIVGTNGKGEVAHSLSGYLSENGLNDFALWTSPHLISLTERFVFFGEALAETELESFLDSSYEIVEQNKLRPTFFEFLFFVFLRIVQTKKPRVLICEAGLGGTFDAINCLNAQLVLLSSISRDHCQILGKRFDQILRQKLGVMRPRATLYSALSLKYLRERVQRNASRNNWQWHDVIDQHEINSDAFYSKRNQYLAFKAYVWLRHNAYSLKSEATALKFAVKHSARIEILTSHEKQFMLLGAHNLDGIRHVKDVMESPLYADFFNGDQLVVLVAFSQRETRELKAMIGVLKNLKRRNDSCSLVWTVYSHPKAISASVLNSLLIEEDDCFYEDFKLAVKQISSHKFLVTGSLYFMGQLKSYLMSLQ